MSLDNSNKDIPLNDLQILEEQIHFITMIEIAAMNDFPI